MLDVHPGHDVGSAVHRPSRSAGGCSVAPVATSNRVVMEGRKPWKGSVEGWGMLAFQHFYTEMAA